jgi:hypothetical protein
VLRKVVDNFLGSWQKPMSDEQMAVKYRRLAAKSLAPEDVEELERLVRNLESAPTVAGLVQALQGRTHPEGARQQ